MNTIIYLDVIVNHVCPINMRSALPGNRHNTIRQNTCKKYTVYRVQI